MIEKINSHGLWKGSKEKSIISTLALVSNDNMKTVWQSENGLLIMMNLQRIIPCIYCLGSAACEHSRALSSKEPDTSFTNRAKREWISDKHNPK